LSTSRTRFAPSWKAWCGRALGPISFSTTFGPQPLLPPEDHEFRRCRTRNVFMAVKPRFVVARGCTRLHTVAQFCRAVGGLLLGLHVKGMGRATHNLCEKARFSVTSVTALLAQELRLTLDFVGRSNCRSIYLCGYHLRAVTLRFPDD